MKDVTDVFLNYREGVRGLWNAHFATWTERDLLAASRFRAIEETVFHLSVIGRIELDTPSGWSFGDPCPAIRLEPVYSIMPVKISRPREGDSNTYWDDPLKELRRAEAVIAFAEFFDFDIVGIRDFEYMKGRVMQCTNHPRLVDQDVLIPTLAARVLI